ncbi:MAG TPA: DUF2934 domain-containing protein [Vicinamibacterales bacterium]|nr:DUF2934 domain-containing protein [Vicinamibacterales bacterium]
MAIVSNNDPADTTQVHATQRDRQPAHAEPSESDIVAEAAAIYPDTTPATPSADEIAAEAYAIYVSRGGDHGRDQDDWLEAERKLGSQRRQS